MHQLVHEDAHYVPITVAEVLVFAIDVVRAEHHIVQPEHVLGRIEVHLHGQLRHPVGILRHGPHVLAHWWLQRPIHRDGAGENEALHLVADRGVDQVDAPDEVVLVVEAPDKMAEALGGIGGQVVHVGEAVLREEPFHKGIVGDGAMDKDRLRVHLVLEAAAEVVQHHHAMAHGQQVLHDMGADEAGAAGHQGSQGLGHDH